MKMKRPPSEANLGRVTDPGEGWLTAWRTVKPPTTPAGEVESRTAAMGSMWASRSGLRPASCAGSSRVRAERPAQCRGCNSSSENLRSHTAWTQARSQSRTNGGAGPVAGSPSQSRGPDSLWLLGYTVKAIEAPNATTLDSVLSFKSDCQHWSDPDVS